MAPDTVCTCALDMARVTGWTVGPLPKTDARVDGTAGGVVDLGPAGPAGAGARLFGLRKLIIDLHKAHKFERLAVEDSAYGSRNQFATQLGQAEYRGVARVTAHQLGLEFLVINPSSWKSWLCGSGKADKEQTQRALAGQFGVRFSSSDEADAFAILAAVLAGVR